MRVLVIGGGPAGLAAAWRLSEAGHAVTVIERRDRLGGRAAGVESRGARADLLAQFLADADAAAKAWLGRAGIGWRPFSGHDALRRRGRVHALEYGSVARLLASGALSWSLKWQLGTKYLPLLQRNRDLWENGDGDRLAHTAWDAETVADWGAREFGEEFVDVVAAPVLGTYLASLPEETTAAMFHLLAWRAHHARPVTVDSGWSAAWAAVCGGIEARGGRIVRGRAVVGVQVDGDRVRVTWEGGEDEAEAAVVAVPPAVAAPWLDAWAPRVAQWLRGFDPVPAISVWLRVATPLRPAHFALSAPRGEGGPLAALLYLDGKGNGTAGLVAILAPEAARELVDAAAETVWDRIRPTVEDWEPRARQGVVDVQVFRWAEGGVRFRPGYFAHRRAGAELTPELGPRVRLAGDYLVHPSIDGAVRSGQEAARALLPLGSR